MDKEFSSVFEGLSKTLDAVDLELDKRFNIIMFVVAIASLVVSLVSLGIAFL